jgi:hypothetical protein
MSRSVKESIIEDFKNTCRSTFNYLVTDFGFKEDKSPPGEFENEFQIRFIRSDLTVVVEGIHHGSAAVVYLQDVHRHQISPIQLKPDFQPFSGKLRRTPPKGQPEDIKEESRLLREYGMGLLNGDFSAFDHALEKARNAWDGYESRRRFGIAEQEAITAFNNQSWSKVVETLEPYEDKISARMARKLKIARENLRSKDGDAV